MFSLGEAWSIVPGKKQTLTWCKILPIWPGISSSVFPAMLGYPEHPWLQDPTISALKGLSVVGPRIVHLQLLTNKSLTCPCPPTLPKNEETQTRTKNYHPKNQHVSKKGPISKGKESSSPIMFQQGIPASPQVMHQPHHPPKLFGNAIFSQKRFPKEKKNLR